MRIISMRWNLNTGKRPRYVKIILLLLVVALVLWRPWSGNDATVAQYEYVPVTRADIEETVTAQGELEPKEFVDVGAQVSGQLQKLHVAIGDNVKKGQLIAEIDPRIYTAQVEASEAQINTLKAQLAEQQAQLGFFQNVYARNQKLMKIDGVSKEALENSEMDYKTALARIKSFQAQIKQAESSLQGSRTNLSFTKIYAPIDGTVVSQTSKEGQTLNANQTAPVIVQVAKLSVMTAKAQVAEADVQRLKAGMPVYFNTLGSDRRWESTLRQLLPSPDATVTDVVLYNALVDVANEDGQLMTGMSTQMFFELGSARQALVIPTRALGKKVTASDGSGETYEVQVRGKKGLEPRMIRVGLMNRTQAEIRSGLEEGEHLAIPTSGTKEADKPRMRF